MATSYDYGSSQAMEYRCKLDCDLAAPSCPEAESCLPDPIGFGQVQDNNASCVDDTACEPGYTCTELSDGSQQCFKRNAICGTTADTCLASTVEEVTACTENDALRCDTLSGHTYCEEVVPADPAADAAFTSCADLGTGGVCLSFCETASGDLDCGAGASCVRPDEPIFYLDVARDAADDYAACVSVIDCLSYNDGDGADFDCIQLSMGGSFCARALKQCMSTGDGG